MIGKIKGLRYSPLITNNISQVAVVKKMMQSKIIFITLLLVVNIACHGQKDKERNTGVTTILSNKVDEKEAHIFIDYLELRGYKSPSLIEFETKNKLYLGIDSTKITSKGYNNIDVNNEFIDYQINYNQRYIKIGQDELPDLDILLNEIKKNTKLPYFENVLTINQILYYDNQNAITRVMNMQKDIATDLVIIFNYEKNDVLTKSVVKNISSFEDQPNYFNWSSLLYNDRSKEEIIRKDLILKLFDNNSDLISQLIIFVTKNRSPVNQLKTDELLAFLLNLKLKEYEKNDWEQNEGYGLVAYCYDTDKSIRARFNENKFFNYILLKNATEAYNTFNPSENSTTYFIQDPDGYTNLRKDKNTSSTIIEKIKSGEEVYVLDNSGNWWLIETKEGKQGYVHKSRIKS